MLQSMEEEHCVFMSALTKAGASMAQGLPRAVSVHAGSQYAQWPALSHCFPDALSLIPHNLLLPPSGATMQNKPWASLISYNLSSPSDLKPVILFCFILFCFVFDSGSKNVKPVALEYSSAGSSSHLPGCHGRSRHTGQGHFSGTC